MAVKKEDAEALANECAQLTTGLPMGDPPLPKEGTRARNACYPSSNPLFDRALFFGLGLAATASSGCRPEPSRFPFKRPLDLLGE